MTRYIINELVDPRSFSKVYDVQECTCILTQLLSLSRGVRSPTFAYS